jgi:hypothetical protein
VAANGRNGPVVSDSSGFARKLVRWCRIRPVVSDWSVGFSVGFLNGNRVTVLVGGPTCTIQWRVTPLADC